MELLKALLTSKRVAGLIVAGFVSLLAHFHIMIPASVEPKLVDDVLTLLTAVWTISTKVIDAKKESALDAKKELGQPLINASQAQKLPLVVIALILLPAVMRAQTPTTGVTASFSQQSDAVTKKITGGVPSMKNVITYETVVCNNSVDTRSLHSGFLYQAAQRNKIAVVGPQQSDFLFRRVKAYHPLAVAFDFAQAGVFALSILGGTSSVNISPALKGSLPIAAQAFKGVADKLAASQPDFTELQSAMFNDQIALPPGVCRMGMLFATAGPKDTIFETIESIVVPAPQATAPKQ